MGVSFQKDIKRTLKNMYNDVLDMYIEDLQKNPAISEKELREKKKDIKEWKAEFSDLINLLNAGRG